MQKNRVVAGDYKGSQINAAFGVPTIVLGFKSIGINRTFVESYELVDGKKSLDEVDDKIYKAIVKSCF